MTFLISLVQLVSWSTMVMQRTVLRKVGVKGQGM